MYGMSREGQDTEAKTAAQAQMLANRLVKRFRHLRKWARREHVESFRLYDCDIPEIPLVLDLYGDAVSGALYKRPYEKDEAEEQRWLEAMANSAAQSLSLEPANIFIKQRQRQRGQAQYEKMADRGLTREVSEGSLKFKVNLSDYLDTGLFPDRRAMRRMVNADSQGKRVLNLFCYTASFSIHAADGGAASTDSVDLSNTYLAWARDNFCLNGLKADILRLEDFSGIPGPCAHRLIRADAAAFLRAAAAAHKRWDSIIADPPAFSNSTMAGDFDLRRDYAALLSRCLSLLAPNGKLWFSASARSFKTGAAEIETALKDRFPGIKVTDMSGKMVDEDFRGKRIPRCFIIC